MDPLADKLLVCAALICMIEPGAHYQIPAWMVLVIISREFIISGFRLVASDSGVVIAASYWGKAKTVSQIVAICVIFLLQYVLELHALGLIALPAYETLQAVFYWIGFALMGVAALLAAISGVIYAKDSAALFRDR